MSGRVLVVDDDKTLCETLQAALEKAGFSVRTAYDGRQCLEAIAAERPDVLVLDVAMPVMDGYKTLHRLRGDSRTHLLPVVLLTGHPGEPGELAGWMAGIDRYLAKPCDIGRLVSVVQELLPKSGGE
jgi:DNA-binding response OmpR family regulator